MASLKQLTPTYSDDAPSNQTMVDILSGGWVTAFPQSKQIVAGDTAHFDPSTDNRVGEIAAIYPFEGKYVCELGPLEAYHTKLLCDAGARPMVAVEANDIAFLKCLIVKELYAIPARFLHGSALRHLESTSAIYDVIWASGMFYHQSDPFRLLQLICDRCKAFYLFTHFWAEQECGVISAFDPSRDEDRTIDGVTARYHFLRYGEKGNAFSGGIEAGAFWMEKQVIIDYIRARGFEIVLFNENPNAPPGPVMTVFATSTR